MGQMGTLKWPVVNYSCFILLYTAECVAEREVFPAAAAAGHRGPQLPDGAARAAGE